VAATALALVASSAATTYADAHDRGPIVPDGLARSMPVAAGGSLQVASSSVKVVSSTGHRLRVRLLAFRGPTTSQIEVGVETRNRVEQHDWTFPVGGAAVSVSTKAKGRIRLGATRSAGYASLSLRSRPHGGFTHTTCQGRVATRTRHVSLSGTLLLRTRSSGLHAWGKVGGAHRKIHFSTRSKVTWVKRAAASCPAPVLACRSTFEWTASGGPTSEIDLLTSADKGAHAEIAGLRRVSLPQPSGASRTDIVSLPQATPNQLVVNTDGSATMQATFRKGTATLTAPQPAITSLERCGAGRRKVAVESWSADFVNGPRPILVPAQTAAAGFARITLHP
jgi:hypothetical protein